MQAIMTSRGMMDEADLAYSEGTTDEENAVVKWQEWRAEDGEIVKRNVHVELKRAPAFPVFQGSFG
jgi:hypothetical protein